MEANPYMNLLCAVRIVTDVVSLIDLVEQCVNYRTKEAVSHYGKNVTSLNSESGKICKRFRYSNNDVNYSFKK